MTLSKTTLCQYTECDILFIVMLIVIMLSVVMMNIIIMSVEAPVVLHSFMPNMHKFAHTPTIIFIIVWVYLYHIYICKMKKNPWWTVPCMYMYEYICVCVCPCVSLCVCCLYVCVINIPNVDTDTVTLGLICLKNMSNWPKITSKRRLK